LFCFVFFNEELSVSWAIYKEKVWEAGSHTPLHLFATPLSPVTGFKAGSEVEGRTCTGVDAPRAEPFLRGERELSFCICMRTLPARLHHCPFFKEGSALKGKIQVPNKFYMKKKKEKRLN